MAMHKPKAVLIDVDGVVIRGQEPIPGAPLALELLDRAGLPWLLVSNNSLGSQQSLVEKLAAVGLPVTPGRVLTSTAAAASYLAEHRPGARVLLLGGEGFAAELRAVGLVVTDSPAGAEVVACGYFPAISYAWLEKALTALDAGALFLASNADGRYPVEGGRFIPGSGAIVGAVSGMVKRPPDVVIGKPEPILLQRALARLGVAAAEAVMVGDNPATDVVAGHRAGCGTVLVLTGVTGATTAFVPSAWSVEERPDSVYPDLLAYVRAVLGAP